jgi:hypothetical protein
MKLLIMKFSPLPCYLVRGPNILLNTQFSNTLSLRSSLNVGDQLSHLYNATDKITATARLQEKIRLSADVREQ